MTTGPGVVVFITGRPSAGKSTLAERVVRALRAEGVPHCLLDGDAVRGLLVPTPGYGQEERADFYATLARLAAHLAEQGLATVVAATAHRRAFRERARTLAPRFIEVFVHAGAAECAERDAKGLYAAQRAGTVANLPGADAGYEEPPHPDVVAEGGLDNGAVSAIVRRVLEGSNGPRSTEHA